MHLGNVPRWLLAMHDIKMLCLYRSSYKDALSLSFKLLGGEAIRIIFCAIRVVGQCDAK
jgi:hypothetical protein